MAPGRYHSIRRVGLVNVTSGGRADAFSRRPARQRAGYRCEARLRGLSEAAKAAFVTASRALERDGLGMRPERIGPTSGGGSGAAEPQGF